MSETEPISTPPSHSPRCRSSYGASPSGRPFAPSGGPSTTLRDAARAPAARSLAPAGEGLQLVLEEATAEYGRGAAACVALDRVTLRVAQGEVSSGGKVLGVPARSPTHAPSTRDDASSATDGLRRSPPSSAAAAPGQGVANGNGSRHRWESLGLGMCGSMHWATLTVSSPQTDRPGSAGLPSTFRHLPS